MSIWYLPATSMIGTFCAQIGCSGLSDMREYDMRDCVIIGGGPAGLTAAIYLARFHLNITVIDAGQSRALWIPTTHNHAGFPNGISGEDLLERMRAQAIKYGTKIVQGRVGSISNNDVGFALEYGHGAVEAATVILATGVVNRRPAISEELHAQALVEGKIRYCPVCDGYEVTDKNVAITVRNDLAAKRPILR
jgi:thioredoxin reductase (NADPH)